MLFKVELKLLYFRRGVNVAGEYDFFFLHLIVYCMYAEPLSKKI